MFALYAVPVGLLLGMLAGGRVTGLGAVRIRWAPLALAGLLVQIALFLGPVAERVGGLGPPVYVASSALVLVVVLANLALPGLPAVAAGASLNLLAIAANGGYMPASPSALASLGKTIGAAYSNSTLTGHPALAPLTDIFALPAGVPFANVFSIGDMIVAVGVVWVLVALMRRDGAPRNLPPKGARVSTPEP